MQWWGKGKDKGKVDPRTQEQQLLLTAAERVKTAAVRLAEEAEQGTRRLQASLELADAVKKELDRAMQEVQLQRDVLRAMGETLAAVGGIGGSAPPVRLPAIPKPRPVVAPATFTTDTRQRESL